MSRRGIAAIVGLALSVGLLLGWLLFGGTTANRSPQSAETGWNVAPDETGSTGSDRASSGDDASPDSGGTARSTAGDGGPHHARPTTGPLPSASPANDESLRRQVHALEIERAELLGRPLPAPAGGQSRRMTGSELAGAFRTALAREEIGGGVEGVECSEYPCIVFGRLDGDEEDVEELERSPALAAYENDVLTLLLWALSRDDTDGAEERGTRERETALFAIAFYTQGDREQFGDALDRRIRGRVLEVWNTDRPGSRGPSFEAPPPTPTQQ